MPADPHSWQQGDFVTASLLNGDLYWSNGQMFTPNGIRFHARRPIYRSYANPATSNTLSANTWGLAFGGSGNNGVSAVIVDTPGLVGGWFDPNQTGNIRLNHLNAGGGSLGGGGLSQVNGGLMLATSFCFWPQTSNTQNLGCGIGDSSAPSTAPASWGTLQATNTAHAVTCFCMDLVDSNAVRYGSFAFNGSSGSLAPVGTPLNADGSGWATRFMAHWASVYPQYGNTVTNLPAPLASWTGQTVTQSLLNGNTGLRGPLRFLNMPPVLRAQATGSQSLSGGVAATANLSATSGMDSYSAFSSNTFTAPFAGLYLVHCYASVGNIGSPFRVGVQVNGSTSLWGPYSPGNSAGGSITGSKTQILSLNAGDTVVMRMQANVAATTNSSFGQPRMIVLYVGATGAPAYTPITAPDTTFRWQAGQQGPVDTLFDTHVANDLGVLIQRPYTLAYQATSQNVAQSTPTVINLDHFQGIVHGDAGDPWNGWGINLGWTAPLSGWYLVVEEVFFTQPTLTATPSVLALFGLNPHGTDTYDRYQQQNMTTSTGACGATAVSYYYLRAGDFITPSCEIYDASSTTLATSVGTGTQSHFEAVWLGEG